MGSMGADADRRSSQWAADAAAQQEALATCFRDWSQLVSSLTAEFAQAAKGRLKPAGSRRFRPFWVCSVSFGKYDCDHDRSLWIGVFADGSWMRARRHADKFYLFPMHDFSGFHTGNIVPVSREDLRAQFVAGLVR